MAHQYQQQQYQPQQPQQPHYPPQGQYVDPMQHQQQQPHYQYQPQQQTQPVVVVQRSEGNQSWLAPFYTWSPFGNCLLAHYVPCILAGKTAARLKDPSLATYDSINNDCMVMAGMTYIGLGWVHAMMTRTEIRERFGIQGSGCGDCCAAWCCPCKVVLQNDNEVRMRLGEPRQGVVVQGYQQNQAMVAPAPAQTQGTMMPAPTHVSTGKY